MPKTIFGDLINAIKTGITSKAIKLNNKNKLVYFLIFTLFIKIDFYTT